MLDPDAPFFAARWRRWAVVVVCLGWAAVEAARGETVWAGGFAVAGFYALWALILAPGARGGTD
jgi:hypothetical protein